MKVAAFNGSPRGSNGATGSMLSALLGGMEESGAEIRSHELGSMRIAPCRGCYTCWQSGRCAIDDEMTRLIPPFIEAEIVVLGTPLYFRSMSGTLKTFIDRLTAAGGDPRSKAGAASAANCQKRLVLVSSCGFSDATQFAALSSWAASLADLLGMRLSGEYYLAGGGELARPGSPESARRAERYREFLRSSGASIPTAEANSAAKSLDRLADF